jgi:hypothetical protein
MKTMTTEQVAQAAGVHPLAVTALDRVLKAYRRRGRYDTGAILVVAMADELAAAVGAGEMTRATAARVLARAMA